MKARRERKAMRFAAIFATRAILAVAPAEAASTTFLSGLKTVKTRNMYTGDLTYLHLGYQGYVGLILTIF